MLPSVPVSVVLLLLLLGPVSSESVNLIVHDLISRNMNFAVRMFRAVSSQTDENVLLSPFTLSTGLTALLSATEGQTREQLQQGLTLTDLRIQDLPDLFQTLKAMVLRGEGTTNLQQSVMLFPSTNFEVSSSYQAVVQKFGGDLQSLVYTVPQEAVDTINRLVQVQTRDQVPELLKSLDIQTQLLLTMAASYQTRFIPAFNSSLSQEERFYVNKYHVVMVPMMFRADKFFLAYDRSLKVGVLKLPMADGAAMLVVLPDEGVDVTVIEEEMTAEKIQTWIQQLKKTKLEVQLPRFLLERQYSLKDSLETLGVTQVFQDDADITKMCVANGPKLTQVFHKSVLSVDERNDAVAAGDQDKVFSTLPPRLTINRPFLFAVYQESSSNLLLLGRVVNPTLK